MKDDLGARLREALRRMLLVFDQGNDLNGGAEQDTCTFARRTLNAPRPPVPIGVMWCEPPWDDRPGQEVLWGAAGHTVQFWPRDGDGGPMMSMKMVPYP